MFKNFRRKSLEKRLVKHLSKRDVSKINAKVKTFGFLVDGSLCSDEEELYKIGKAIGFQEKDMKVFFFIESSKKIPSLRQDQVYNKDFNWRGELQNVNAKEFLEKDLDVLVGFYSGKNPFLDLMMARSKAKFKVGFAESDSRLYDLLIGVPVIRTREFTSELKKYLTILNKI